METKITRVQRSTVAEPLARSSNDRLSVRRNRLNKAGHTWNRC